MVKAAMMQPAFLPWQGFFELICMCDVFVFLDDFQFSIQSYHQRNRLFVDKGRVDWYTVPIRKKASFQMPLNRTEINEAVPWRKKTWKRIRQNYSKAAHFADIAPGVEEWLAAEHDSLAAQNMAFIRQVCRLLGFGKEFRLSSDFPSTTERSQRVLDILAWCGAERYYSAGGSFGYMREDGLFPWKEVEVLFQDFQPRPYRQVGAKQEFVPYLSVLDALMNVGAAETAALIRGGTRGWRTWDEMCVAAPAAPAPRMPQSGA